MSSRIPMAILSDRLPCPQGYPAVSSTIGLHVLKDTERSLLRCAPYRKGDRSTGLRGPFCTVPVIKTPSGGAAYPSSPEIAAYGRDRITGELARTTDGRAVQLLRARPALRTDGRHRARSR